MERTAADINIEKHIAENSWLYELQSSPVAIITSTSLVVYVNSAFRDFCECDEIRLGQVKIGDCLLHIRGIQKYVSSCFSENTIQSFNKTHNDTRLKQLVPLQIKLVPLSAHPTTGCDAVMMVIEKDIEKLTRFFHDEKDLQKEKIFELGNSLRENTRLVNAIFDNSPVGMMILNADGDILQINTSGKEILQLEGLSVTGMSCQQFYLCMGDGEYRPAIQPEQVEALTYLGETRMLMRCAARSGGGEDFIVETFVDVTEIDNAKKQIEKAKDAAERSNRTKSEFIANISHELRTPLHAVMGYAQFGVARFEKSSAEKIKDYFQKIHNSGNVLLTLLNDLLDLSKLEAGKMQFEKSDCDLVELIISVIDEFEVLLESRNIDVAFDTEARKEIAWLDKDKVKQLMRNLISNAIKFSPDNTAIRIFIEPEIDSVLIKVSDQGKGIPDDELEEVFDKFIQSTRTHTGAGGTGLGLAICREIVEGHGGTIWADHSDDGGALFTAKIPRNYRAENIE